MMSIPTSRPSRRPSIAAALALVAALTASPAFARARVCADAYGSGGCVESTTCWHFDHDGNWAGTVYIDYAC
jgi:hypothetical protein